MTRLGTFSQLARDIAAAPGPVRLVGIDGCGGAGKTTFAARLSTALGDAPVVHTDDFASHDVPLDWAPLLLHDVVEPLLRNEPASYRPYDWLTRTRQSTPTVLPPQPVVLIEGVGAIRREWRDRLARRIWIDAPRDVRLRRGLARDGEELREFWLGWMAAEDRYVATDAPMAAADFVVDGDPVAAHDASKQFVVLRDRTAAADDGTADSR